MPEFLCQHKDGVLIAQFTSDKILDDVLIVDIGRELLELAEQAEGKMLLDFQGVTFMSSAMIGKVVLLSKKCRANKAELRMCNVPASVIDVLDKRRLNTVFKICDSVEEALNDLARCGDPHGL
jgi:anti-sigma B factor antagonist